MALTAVDLVQEAKKTIKEVNIDQANTMIADGSTALDIREPAEYEAGNIPNSIHIPRGVLEFQITDHPSFQDRDASIVIYCRSGGRSALAAKSLEKLGYTNTCSMAGGYTSWAE